MKDTVRKVVEYVYIVNRIYMKYCPERQHGYPKLIKKKIKFSSFIRKFRMEQLQSHICLTASSYMANYLCISLYNRKPFLIYDFATAPFLISLKGHGNEADFLGFLQKLVPHESLTLPLGPFRFWLRIRGDIRIRKTTPRYHRYGESPTPRISDTGSRQLPGSLIRGVANSPDH
jgi:hypothetical protein